MKKALKVITLFIGILILVFVVGAYLIPAHIDLERSIVIDAPPERVYPFVNSFTGFNEWSPWAELDPDTAYDFTGPPSGVGARMEWTSEHPNVGVGSQEIVATTPNERVETILVFGEQPPSAAVFVLESKGDNKTRVTWEFHADAGYNPVSRWVGLFMDRLLGPDYEKGLDNLKRVVEAS